MQHHYDAIVCGEGLAARIAALLLARGGCRVLAFRDPAVPSTPQAAWFFPCLFLERLLENLGGKSCYIPVAPFQVLTSENRLEFHGRNSLEEELCREFPADGDGISAALGRLQALGRHLEEALWRSGGLPVTGLRSRLRFAGRRWRPGLGPGLSAPLSGIWKNIREASARETLAALFTGLALRPPEKLSVAEGALLWHGAAKADGLSRSALEDLLQNRYAQFHGETESLSGIDSLDCGGSPVRGVLKGGGKFSADLFLLAECSSKSPLQPEPSWRRPLPPAGESFTATLLEGRPSPLLAPRFILSGPSCLRVSFLGDASRKTCLVETPSRGDSAGISTEEVQSRLSPVFPFARLRVEERPTHYSDSEAQGSEAPRFRRTFPGVAGPLRLGKNAYDCNAAALLPSLGNTGEALVGVSVANHLLGRLRKGK